MKIHVSSNRLFFISFCDFLTECAVLYRVRTMQVARMHARTHAHTQERSYSPFPLLTAEVFPEEVRGSRLLRKSLSRLEQRHLWSQCLLISHVIDICPRGKSDAVRTETTINWLTDWLTGQLQLWHLFWKLSGAVEPVQNWAHKSIMSP